MQPIDQILFTLRPLPRTRQTSKIIRAGLGDHSSVDIKIDDRLNQVGYHKKISDLNSPDKPEPVQQIQQFLDQLKVDHPTSNSFSRWTLPKLMS